jgi:hypothetical protein
MLCSQKQDDMDAHVRLLSGLLQLSTPFVASPDVVDTAIGREALTVRFAPVLFLFVHLLTPCFRGSLLPDRARQVRQPC